MRDTAMFSIIDKEAKRQKQNVELIASENFVSKEVREAQGSVLTNKYAEGYPGKRYYGGCVYVDQAEDLTRQRAKELFKAEHANVQPHSGSQANMAVYNTLLQPGDVVLGMDLAAGGHLTHGHPLNFSGTLYKFVAYNVDPETELIDYDALEELAIKTQPKLIVAGASAYPRIIDFKRFSEIAKKVNAYLMVVGFFICGLAIANVVPVMLSETARISGVNQGKAISFVGTLGYSGLLLGPGVLGMVATLCGLRGMFIFTASLVFGLGLMSFYILRKID